MYGDHAISCQGEGDLTRRHNNVRNILNNFAANARMFPKMEVPHLLLNGGNSKPADILIENYDINNKPCCIDVTVANSLKDAYNVSDSTFDPHKTIKDAEMTKNNLYLSDCKKANMLFYPFVVGSLGGYNEDAENILKKIGKNFANVYSKDGDKKINQVKIQIDISIQRNQANAIIRRGELAGNLIY